MAAVRNLVRDVDRSIAFTPGASASSGNPIGFPPV